MIDTEFAAEKLSRKGEKEKAIKGIQGTVWRNVGKGGRVSRGYVLRF